MVREAVPEAIAVVKGGCPQGCHTGHHNAQEPLRPSQRLGVPEAVTLVRGGCPRSHHTGQGRLSPRMSQWSGRLCPRPSQRSGSLSLAGALVPPLASSPHSGRAAPAARPQDGQAVPRPGLSFPLGLGPRDSRPPSPQPLTCRPAARRKRRRPPTRGAGTSGDALGPRRTVRSAALEAAGPTLLARPWSLCCSKGDSLPPCARALAQPSSCQPAPAGPPGPRPLRAPPRAGLPGLSSVPSGLHRLPPGPEMGSGMSVWVW